MSKHKHVIIYLPNGNICQYSTKDLGDKNIEIADAIVCELNEVQIAMKTDNKTEGYAYVGMPYILNMW